MPLQSTLNPPSASVPVSRRTEMPPICHDEAYTRNQRLVIALSHYYAELQKHTESPTTTTKPVILQIAKLYDVSDATLGRHIRNPTQRSQEDVHKEQQVLTPEEETALVERLLLLDDFNVPASKSQLYRLANALLHRREPKKTIGSNWIYRFLSRHEECRYLVVKAIASNRANAVTWNMIDDFFAKVCEISACDMSY